MGDYRVQPGDTVSAIAASFGVSQEELRASNGLRGDSIAADQTLHLPNGARVTHAVVAGDTLGGIAQAYGTTVQHLCELNPRLGATSVLALGRQIIVPTRAHAVQSGDSAGALAQRYHSTVDTICRASTPTVCGPQANLGSLQVGEVLLMRPTVAAAPEPDWGVALAAASTPGAGALTIARERLDEDENGEPRQLTGVQASHALAQGDLEAITAIADVFVSVGDEVGLPPALLAALASRETHCGATMRSDGLSYDGRAFGILQVEQRFGRKGADPRGHGHVLQAARHLRSVMALVRRDHPEWTPSQQLRGSVAAYNMGASNVRTLAGVDTGTAHDDYSGDVIARAQYLQHQVPAFAPE